METNKFWGFMKTPLGAALVSGITVAVIMSICFGALLLNFTGSIRQPAKIAIIDSSQTPTPTSSIPPPTATPSMAITSTPTPNIIATGTGQLYADNAVGIRFRLPNTFRITTEKFYANFETTNPAQINLESFGFNPNIESRTTISIYNIRNISQSSEEYKKALEILSYDGEFEPTNPDKIINDIKIGNKFYKAKFYVMGEGNTSNGCPWAGGANTFVYEVENKVLVLINTSFHTQEACAENTEIKAESSKPRDLDKSNAVKILESLEFL